MLFLGGRRICRGSSAGFLLCKRFRRTLLQNPKRSAEFWGEGGARTRLLRTGFFLAYFLNSVARLFFYLVKIQLLLHKKSRVHVIVVLLWVP